MQQPDIRTSLCNSSLPSSLYRMSYFMRLKFPFFCRDDDDTILLAYSVPSFLHPTLPRSSNFTPRRRTLCVRPFIFESRDSTPSPPINKPPCDCTLRGCTCEPNFMRPCTQDRFLNISIVSEKLCREPAVCVCSRWARRATGNGAKRAKVDRRNLVESFDSTRLYSTRRRRRQRRSFEVQNFVIKVTKSRDCRGTITQMGREREERGEMGECFIWMSSRISRSSPRMGKRVSREECWWCTRGTSVGISRATKIRRTFPTTKYFSGLISFRHIIDKF